MKVGPKKFDTPPEIFGMCAPEYISYKPPSRFITLTYNKFI